MADRDEAMLRQCRSVIAARRRRAEGRHAEALHALDAAEAARLRAGEALLAAERVWREQMQRRFDPLLGGLLGRDLQIRAGQAVRADAQAQDAAVARGNTEQLWRQEDGRWRMLDDAVVAARRNTAHRAEETQLMAATDRLCFRWSRR